MSPERWTDERLDDLRDILVKNGERLDVLQNLVAAHDLQLTEVERERRSRIDQRYSFRLAIFTVVVGQVGTIVTLILTRIH